MKNIVIGTAGHIDHGKTTLIKALTGRDTDRLKEEKKRGISIDLGFTHFDLPSGKRAGIIDVPGHEKFIRNMLAGVGGMDIVMLVVAADEGVMPQTKEHLDILNMINIKKGIIVVTKIGLVDEEWLQLIQEDIRSKVQDTFLEDSEMILVDSVKGIGVDKLIALIDNLADETESRDINSPVRMPIDRVFSITGFGTVVTGTLMEGKITVEDTLEILPEEVKVRVRNIQVHGKSVETAYAGQRVAINLANIKKEDIERGQVLAQINSMENTLMMDGRINVLRDYERILSNRDRVRLYYGSTEVLARVVLLNKEEVKAGETALIQLRLEETAAVKKGDRIIMIHYSPMETIGGFIVIDGNPKKHKAFDEKVIKELELKEKASPEDILEKQIERYSKDYPDISFLAKALSQQPEEILLLIEELANKKKVVRLDNNFVIHIKSFEKLKEDATKLLKDYHSKNPLKTGIQKEEFKNKIFPKGKGKVVDSIMELMDGDFIEIKEKFVSLKGFEVILNDSQQLIKSKLEEIYLSNPFSPPKLEDALKTLKYNSKDIQQVVEAMLGNELIRLNQEVLIHKKVLIDAKEKLISFIENKGSITLADYRDVLDTSRKYAVALLEYFDSNKVTKRAGDERILY
ncbi:selenocysteine-specific translation elongation factor [Alkaliphilus serpentinus]|uniref:Selenocysteine-specific elongation factor n=1 Tax=Alkaliphilus serpentinus TaxID=1482731 RepID=A0A833HRC6_9FIRM|nr:selenocysteine-specific translation elongation factor [Alkaliphilus serpentinus]KAB3533105.1 selenocysteine-specific translation elongation factor [Alkaliphilus serpentinus]